MSHARCGVPQKKEFPLRRTMSVWNGSSTLAKLSHWVRAALKKVWLLQWILKLWPWRLSATCCLFTAAFSWWEIWVAQLQDSRSLPLCVVQTHSPRPFRGATAIVTVGFSSCEETLTREERGIHDSSLQLQFQGSNWCNLLSYTIHFKFSSSSTITSIGIGDLSERSKLLEFIVVSGFICCMCPWIIKVGREKSRGTQWIRWVLHISPHACIVEQQPYFLLPIRIKYLCLPECSLVFLSLW